MNWKFLFSNLLFIALILVPLNAQETPIGVQSINNQADSRVAGADTVVYQAVTENNLEQIVLHIKGQPSQILMEGVSGTTNRHPVIAGDVVVWSHKKADGQKLTMIQPLGGSLIDTYPAHRHPPVIARSQTHHCMVFDNAATIRTLLYTNMAQAPLEFDVTTLYTDEGYVLMNPSHFQIRYTQARFLILWSDNGRIYSAWLNAEAGEITKASPSFAGDLPVLMTASGELLLTYADKTNGQLLARTALDGSDIVIDQDDAINGAYINYATALSRVNDQWLVSWSKSGNYFVKNIANTYATKLTPSGIKEAPSFSGGDINHLFSQYLAGIDNDSLYIHYLAIPSIALSNDVVTENNTVNTEIGGLDESGTFFSRFYYDMDVTGTGVTLRSEETTNTFFPGSATMHHVYYLDASESYNYEQQLSYNATVTSTNNLLGQSLTSSVTVFVEDDNETPGADTYAPTITLYEDQADSILITNIHAGDNLESQLLNFSYTSDVALFDSLRLMARPLTEKRIYHQPVDQYLSFYPDEDNNGATTVTLTIQDDGMRHVVKEPGTKILDNVLETTLTYQVNIVPVNDAPSMDAITDISIPEDSPQQNILLTGISPGPANESAQTVALSVSSDLAIFSTLEIQTTGDPATRQLVYESLPNQFGDATITVTLKDNGGTTDGGADEQLVSFNINVMAVNDQPVIDTPADVSKLEDAGVIVVDLTGITVGSIYESQTLQFNVASSNTNLVNQFNVIHSAGASTAQLQLTPEANQHGDATITLQVVDDGGTSNSGTDRAQVQFNLSITDVNDAPLFDRVDDVSIDNDGLSHQLNMTGIYAGPVNENSQVLSFTISSNQPYFDALSIDYVQGTDVATISYQPKATANGVCMITIRLSDSGGTANGGVDMWTQDFNLTLNNTATILNTEKTTPLKIYPNPVSEVLTIELPHAPIEGTRIQIFAMNGQLIKVVPVFSKVTTIDVRDLAKGMYQFIITEGDKTSNGRFVVK